MTRSGSARFAAASLACALAALALAGPSRAQDAAGLTGADEFAAGRRHYEARAYVDAVRELRASLALRSSPNTRLYLARALRELGRNGEAYREFARAAGEAEARAGEEPRYAPTARVARAEGQALLSRIALLTVSVVDAPPGAEVRVQGEVLEPSAWGSPRAMDPGSVHVELSAPGRPSARATVDLSASNETRVALRLEAAPGAAPAVRIGGDEPARGGSSALVVGSSGAAPEGPAAQGWPRLALGLLIGGGVLAVGGSVAGVFALTTHSALLRDCALDEAGACTQRPDDAEARVAFGRTAGVLFTTGVVLGGLVAASGLGVLLVDRSSERGARSARGGLRLEVGAGPGGVALRGAF